MRLTALKEMGFTYVPNNWIKKVDNLTQEQKDEFLIKDNLAYGEWEWDMLQDLWSVEQLDAWGLEIPEYKIKREAQEDHYPVKPQGEDTTIKRGDLIEIGQHRLLCGDATSAQDWQRLTGGQLLHMIFTDPPYNINYSGGGVQTSTTILGDHQTEENFRAFLHDTGALYCCYASRTHREFEDSLEAAGFEIRNQIIWTKLVASMGWGDYRWKHEPILYCHKKGQKLDFYGDRKQYTEWTEEIQDKDLLKLIKAWRRDMLRLLKKDQSDEQLLANVRTLVAKQESGGSTVWRFNRDTNYQHPTQKPVNLVAKALQNSSKLGDLVGDPFSGSGTTMVACHQMGRICRAMELDPRHCQTIINRMKELDPSLEVIVTPGA